MVTKPEQPQWADSAACLTNRETRRAALGCQKHDRAFFEQAATLSGFSPEQLLLIDDTAANISVARRLGWKAVDGWKEALCPLSCQNFNLKRRENP
ncbi:HAD-IA family hydrolase [Pararhizobium sp. LjRoot238]|uniref:HAD-IA family hydrolase n=1 Tax=Pararhizobium sp. LjRoot238 TaxID=3342293 RepID=UPI003F50CDA2